MADKNEHTEAHEKRLADRKEQTEATKKRLADEKAHREKVHAELRDAAGAVKPTPTQEENDLAASGEHVIEHEPDGSPPEGDYLDPRTRTMESGRLGGTYTTREARAPAPTPPKPHSTHD